MPLNQEMWLTGKQHKQNTKTSHELEEDICKWTGMF